MSAGVDTAVRLLGVDLTVHEVVAETPDAVSIVFDVDPHADQRFDYQPGQFLTLRIPSERTGHVARCYSLASSPAEDARLKVTVKRTNDGYASNWLCDNAKAGLALRVLPPSGTFTAESFDRDLVLYAGGSGITPIMSILRTALTRSDRDIVLFYANRDRSAVIFSAELGALVARYPGRLRVDHWLEDERGIPSARQLREFTGSHVDHRAFICGPAPFMSAVEQALVANEVPGALINIERFSSLDGDPFIFEPAAADACGESSQVTVSLDGEVHRLAWPVQSTLIDVLLSAGIDAPYSCREGECGSCVCELRSGAVDPGNNSALDPADIEDGYILACQAKPTSEEVAIEF